ncbi:hypothetical protein LBMAG03_13210 [Actinomycetes bacterium]|nr:hypothetical protein LBMAG03_13210 [Actinomycetes bacterium]
MTILTVFRSRLRPEAESAYNSLASEMSQLARNAPGFLEEKSFVATDGERVTIVLFSDDASHAAWRDHPRHREAQERGKHELYLEYQIYSAEIDYVASFSHDAVS